VTNRIFIYIGSDPDILLACRIGRLVALELGFSTREATLIATAIAALVHDLALYGKTGQIVLQPIQDKGRGGLAVSAREHGPGVANMAYALPEGNGTAGGLGVGWAGRRRLMDEWVIASVLGQGTTVTGKKWLPGPPNGLGHWPLDAQKQ
jgi:serine/threonine-protein kinase RsbT